MFDVWQTIKKVDAVRVYIKESRGKFKPKRGDKNLKNSNDREKEIEMPKRKRNPLQRAVMAVVGVMVVYVSNYTPDPVVRTAVFVLGLGIVIYAALK